MENPYCSCRLTRTNAPQAGLGPRLLLLRPAGAGSPQHGLSSKKTARITSDCGEICSLRIKWPESPRVAVCPSGRPNERLGYTVVGQSAAVEFPGLAGLQVRTLGPVQQM